MEREIVLAGDIALAAAFGGWLLTRTPSKRRLQSNTKTLYLYFALFMIGDGIVNLLCGFLEGKMYWVKMYGISPRGPGANGWIFYEDYKRAFTYLGVLYAAMIFFGLAMLRTIYFFSGPDDND
jgi:hypothetical protein